MRNDAGPAPSGADWGALVGRFIIYVPLVGFLVHLVIELAGDVDDWKVTTLKAGLIWLVGVNGIITGTGHMFMPARSPSRSGGPRAGSSGRSGSPISPTESPA